MAKKRAETTKRVRIWCLQCRGGDGYFDIPESAKVEKHFASHDGCDCKKPEYVEMA